MLTCPRAVGRTVQARRLEACLSGQSRGAESRLTDLSGACFISDDYNTGKVHSEAGGRRGSGRSNNHSSSASSSPSAFFLPPRTKDKEPWPEILLANTRARRVHLTRHHSNINIQEPPRPNIHKLWWVEGRFPRARCGFARSFFCTISSPGRRVRKKLAATRMQPRARGNGGTIPRLTAERRQLPTSPAT